MTSKDASLENPTRTWQYGLFSCMENKTVCCWINFLCPPAWCITLGCVVNKQMPDHPFLEECLKPIVGCCVCQRSLFRMSYRIDGNYCEDCFVYICCPPCTVMQMYNEVALKGPIFDP